MKPRKLLILLVAEVAGTAGTAAAGYSFGTDRFTRNTFVSPLFRSLPLVTLKGEAKGLKNRSKDAK